MMVLHSSDVLPKKASPVPTGLLQGRVWRWKEGALHPRADRGCLPVTVRRAGGSGDSSEAGRRRVAERSYSERPAHGARGTGGWWLAEGLARAPSVFWCISEGAGSQ